LWLLIIHLITNSQNNALVIENFNNNLREWEITDEGQRKSFIQNGIYYITNNFTESEPTEFLNHFIVDPNSEYSIEAKIRQVSGITSKGFGLVWGYESPSDFVCFMIQTRNNFSIYGKKSDSLFIIQALSPLEKGIVNRFGKENEFSIQKTKNSISFFINKNLVYTGEPIEFKGTKLGFKLDNQVSLEVEHLIIQRKRTALNLVEDYETFHQLENLGPAINSAHSENAPVISPDGKTLFVVRKHPDNTYGKEDSDIWFSVQNEHGIWQKLHRAEFPLNNENPNFVISVLANGNTLLLGNTYKSDGSPDSSGVSISLKKDGKWQIPVKQDIINYENNNEHVNYSLTADGEKLLMSIENDNCIGAKDLFVSFKEKNDTWSEPKNLGPMINTFADDFSPFLAVDNKTLYFASFGHEGYGSSDIFVSRRIDETWTNWTIPQNLGPVINTKEWEAYYSVSAYGDYAFLVSYNSDISLGESDIFRVKLVKEAQPEPVAMISGRIINKKTNEILDTDILFENLTSGEDQKITYSRTDGGFSVILPKGARFGFRADTVGFIPVSQNIDLENLEESLEKEIDLYVVPIEKDQVVTLNNIFSITTKLPCNQNRFQN